MFFRHFILSIYNEISEWIRATCINYVDSGNAVRFQTMLCIHNDKVDDILGIGEQNW